ncbi:hypothetical protein [Noviherbaspirillum sp. ST9]|uniref:hypothetical protein n=1 Tax=Noviherbaspirillum sp. ST9 TaxID=3401606 RepID=UPI003B588BAF
MTDPQTPEASSYDPNRLFDALIDRMHLKNDAQLCRELNVEPPLVSKIRHRRLPMGGSLLIRMHEVSGLTIAELRHLMGDRRQKYRISAAPYKSKSQQTRPSA